jgi:UDP-glucuronate 4-epimerase
MTTLITGTAGFIGFHLAERLLRNGSKIVGIDSVNDYYDPGLKRARLARLLPNSDFHSHEFCIEDRQKLSDVFEKVRPKTVVHLAAQAGVRYSLTNPFAYLDSNLTGFLNILEQCRHHQIQHLVYASSSSVYGSNRKTPFSVDDPADHPVSLYAATKRANELMAHSYSHLYNIPCTGLRFFTVYGPWGRPDMAIFKFAKAILEGYPIDVYNDGKMRRDFTYIDDIIEGVVRVTESPPTANPNWDAYHPEPASSSAPYRIFNIGNNSPVELMHVIETLERQLGKTAEKRMLPMQPGDVLETAADVESLTVAVGFRPSTLIETGIARFVEWYRAYYAS